MFVKTILTAALYAAAAVAAAEQPKELLLAGFESVEGLQTGGQKEISFDLSTSRVTQGKRSLHIHVEIDHRNAEQVGKVKYPLGWPSVKKVFPKPIDLSNWDFVEFDVWFESRRGIDPDFAMHVTLADSKGREIYRTTLTDLRHRKWAREKLCIRGIANASDLASAKFWLSESMYDDGSVIDFYVDNLRATKAVDYRPPAVRPVRRVLVRTDAALLWLEGPCRKVQRTEESPSGAANPVVHMAAARNETEAVQIVLRPLTADGLGEVSVNIGELVGPSGARIAREHITWSPVAYVPARRGPREGSPDGLPGPKPFAADKRWQYPIWVEAYVPPGTPAGDYTAPVVVRTACGDLRVTLRLHVWDFDVPVKQHLRTNTTIYGPWGWRKDIRKWFGDMTYAQFINEWRPEIVKLLARYRLSPNNMAHLPLRYDTHKNKVVLGDTSAFERLVKLYMSWGHRLNRMPVSFLFDRGAYLGAKKGTPEYLQRITSAFRVAANYLEKKGWLDDCYVYCADEVVVHKHTGKTDFALLNRVFDAIHAAHPKIRIFATEAPSPLLRGVDIWCMNMRAFDLDVLKEQHALGREVWWYNGYADPRPGMRITARGADHRVLFWMNWKYGIDGYLIWTVNRWVNNPWEEPDRDRRAIAGGHYLLYPNPDGSVSPSIRLAMMRDGLEDFEYHWLLADRARKLRAAGRTELADECESILRRADAFLLAWDNCPHVQASFIYDSRRLLARQIEKAQAQLH